MATSTPLSYQGVLVIDDNPGICNDFRKILHNEADTSGLLAARATLFEDTSLADTPESFIVDCTNQGQKGLEMVQSALQRGCPYAVVFVDMLMPPGWDGIETIDQLWRVDPTLQVVLCTAFTDLVRDRLALRSHYSDKLLILRKPFDNIEVWQLTNVLVQKRQLAQHIQQQTASLHHLLEPLRAVTSDLALLTRASQGHLDSAADAALNQAIASVTRMRQLLEGLLDVKVG